MEIRMKYRHLLNGRLLKGGRVYADLTDSECHELVENVLADYFGQPPAEVREKKVIGNIEKR